MHSFIECKALSKRYYRQKNRDVHALRHVNLSIEKEDIFGIIGLSGAGKSTLLRCLATLETPTFGQIFIDGQEISSLKGAPLRLLRKKIGLIFQHFNLFSSRSVRANISYPMEIMEVAREPREKKIDELLELVGLIEEQDAYPAQLSGGQKQRVGIARALANEPEILFCDEATSALDPKTTQEILALLKRLKETLKLTVVLITHEMEVIKQICNKVAVLEKGELVEMGTLAEVFIEPKHPVTKNFVQKVLHELPPPLLGQKGTLFHLHFKGKKANQPILSQMIKHFDVEANILLGWIDALQMVTVGNLVVELRGTKENIKEALLFLKEQGVLIEEMPHG